MSFIFSINTHSVVARELFKMILLSFVFQLSTVFYPQIVVHGQLQNELYTLSSVSKSDWISKIVAKYSKIKDEFSCATKCNLNVCNAWVFDNSSQTCTLGNVIFFMKGTLISILFEVLCWTPGEVVDFEMVFQAKSKKITTCKF